MKLTAKIILVLLAIGSLLVLFLWTGCKSPTSEKEEPPPITRNGVPLHITDGVLHRNPPGLPWLITDDWIIPDTVHLTIEAGTEIMFAMKKIPSPSGAMLDERLWMDVTGVLTAIGTPALPIIFTSAYLQPDLGQWRGLKLRNSTTPSTLKYCVFSYGAYFDTDTTTPRGLDAQSYKGMLAISHSSPVIEHCVVLLNQNNAIFISGNDCDPLIRYNIFWKNDASAVRTDTNVTSCNFRIEYNNVEGNSALPFIVCSDAPFGTKTSVNRNLDSCDVFFNIELSPGFLFPNPDVYRPVMKLDSIPKLLGLKSCSPCVDAGLGGVDADSDQTPADLGVSFYRQEPGELRGVKLGTLNQPKYRMSCNVRVPEGDSLVIPAGTKIETDSSGVYALEVFGRLVVNGTPDQPVEIYPRYPRYNNLWGGLKLYNVDTLSSPSVMHNAVLSHYQRADVLKPGVRFEHCRFIGGLYYGMRVATDHPDLADSVSFVHCTFDTCGEYGLYINGCAATVRNSLIQHISGQGILLNNVGQEVLLSNTLVRVCSTSAVVMKDGSSPELTNNVFAQNNYHGVYLFNNCNPVISNSIFSHNRFYGIYEEQSSQSHVTYSDFFSNGFGNLRNADTTHSQFDTTHCYLVDPLFRNLTVGDVHLKSTGCGDGTSSPCIDAGDPALQDGTLDCEHAGRGTAACDLGVYGGPLGGINGQPYRSPSMIRWASK